MDFPALARALLLRTGHDLAEPQQAVRQLLNFLRVFLPEAAVLQPPSQSKEAAALHASAGLVLVLARAEEVVGP